jgi:hypothetical protein
MNTRSEASPPVIDEGMVERACDALLEALRPHIAAKYPDAVDMDKTWADATEEERAIFIPAMHAALEAGCAGLVVENALLKRAFLAGHAEGWTGNQQRRDVQHVDAEKSWNLYVENGALNKSRTALRGDREQGEG